MNNYPKVRVAERALVLMGQSPPSATCSESGDGLPFIQGNGEFGVRYPSPRLRCSAPTRVAEAGDLLMSVRAPVGEVNQATTRTVIGRGLSALRFSADDQDFAWHALRWSTEKLNKLAQGSTFVAVSRQDVETLEIPWHGVANKRIAAVLDTVDEAIAKTEAVIAKLKHVRAGLLHDLLTRGLDEHGELRDPVAHPEQFKDSPLGRIPREWEIAFVGQLFEMQLGKMLSPKAKAGGDSRPYVGNRHVLWDRVECSDLEYMDFTAEERTKFALRVDDLLVCEGGEVGRTAIWCGEVVECFFQKAIHRLRPKDDRIIPQYMLAFMKRAAERGAFVNLTSQTSIAHLTQEKLAILPVALPPRIEQERMIEAWSSLDVEQRYNEGFLAKLNHLKSGLMDDLLTGRVRVPEHIMDGGGRT